MAETAESEFMQNSKKKTHVQEFEKIPPLYKDVQKVINQVKSYKGNFKTVMEKSRLRGWTYKKVYSLVTNVLKTWPILEKVVEDTELLVKEPFLQKTFALILIYELIYGKGLPGESRPVQAIRKHEKEIREAHNIAKKEINLNSLCPTIPKYARVNTLVTSVSAVLQDLRNYGFQQLTYDKNTSLDGYMNLVKSLQVGYFIIDFHFKDLFVFSSKENLPRLHLHQNGLICIQDKSSYIPVHALDPKPGDTVLDACAAPGMKTMHIAAAMKNEGKIYAIEKCPDRFKTLQSHLELANVTIAEAECEDFYLVNADDPKYRSVECILVDPSCSGTGMVNRLDPAEDSEQYRLRLRKLGGFQILLLKHALLFRSVKRVVYSTCSVHEEENEYVVHEILNKFGNMFKLVSVMPDWPIRGSSDFEYGPLCLRANPNESLTNGFFVAMFERLDNADQGLPLYDNLADDSKWFNKKWNSSGGNKEVSKNELPEAANGNDFYSSSTSKQEKDMESEAPKKKHKKKHGSKDNQILELGNVTENVKGLKFENLDTNTEEFNENSVLMEMETDAVNDSFIKKKKHKKKKSKDHEIIPEGNISNTLECNAADELESTPGIKKQKRKSKDHDTVLDENTKRRKVDEDIENEEKLHENNEENEFPSAKKKHKRNRKKAEDHDTVFDENTKRIKMDKELHENNEENESPSAKKKHKRNRKKAEDQDEVLDENALELKVEMDKNETTEISNNSPSKKKHKKSKRNRKKSEDQDRIVDKNASRMKLDENIGNEKNLGDKNEDASKPNDSPSKKHKKKCKDKKKHEE